MSRPAPFSMRLSEDERQQLEMQAGSMPLASYVKSVVFADEAPKYLKSRRPPVADQPDSFVDFLSEFGIICQDLNLKIISSEETDQRRAFEDFLRASQIEGISEEQKQRLFSEFHKMFRAASQRRSYALIVDEGGLDYESIQLPRETYSHAHKHLGENIVQFLERVWKPLIQQGATRVDLRNIDPSAEKAVNNYTSIRPDGTRRELPGDLYLPTKKDLNDRLLAQVSEIPNSTLEAIVAAKRRRKAEKKRLP